jgi:hypothetical protein
MPAVKYVNKNFKPDTLDVIGQANAICAEYSGYSLTLRQLYYQFVARGLVANNQQSYNRLGSIINDARLAGLFDWNNITDRTRNLEREPYWDSPQQALKAVTEQYLTDLWEPTKRRVEVWIEKDAAIGVIESICNQMHVPFFSCRGYVSQSEMWVAANRIGGYLRNGEQTTILHIGDHDPSGLDMTRDIEDRLSLFINTDWSNQYMGRRGGFTRGQVRESMFGRMLDKGLDEAAITTNGYPWRVKRIALTIDQIEEYQPPPNYAKTTDSRFESYMEATGLDESWELDALDPAVMESLIAEEIDAILEPVMDLWDEAEKAQETDRLVLKAIIDNWENIKSVHAPKTEGGAA